MKKAKLILAGVLIVTGCSSSHTISAPTSFETSAFGSVTADPFVVAQQTGLAAACPATPPFTAAFNVVVVGSNGNLVVTSIDFHFVDQSGIPMPPVTLPAPVPITQFGSALAEARPSQIFPLTVRFGCGTSARGTVFVNVGTSDTRGRQTVTHLSVDVR
jgi:hypothetical protein